MFLRLTVEQSSWDEFILRNGGGFLQSWSWMEFQRALGREIVRCRLEEGDELHGGGEAVAQFASVMNDLPLGFRYAAVPRGPVVMSGVDGVRDHFGAALVAVSSLAVRQGAIFAKVEPPFKNDGDIIANIDMRDRGFRAASPTQPATTAIVDLSQGEDALMAKMHQKTRYNIRLAERHGVTVRRAASPISTQDKDAFWNLLEHTAERDKFHAHSRHHYDTMFDLLGASADDEPLALELWFADVEGQPAAAAVVAYFGDTATYLHGASMSELRQHMAPNLLHWQIMRDAKARGFKTYDFWGVAPTDDPEHTWAGISRFKMGFGARRVSYLGAWELPLQPFWYSLYRAARRILHP